MEKTISEKKEEENAEVETADQAPELTNMDVVFQQLGGAGRYSVFTLVVMILAHSQIEAITLSPVFTTVQLAFNCTEGQPPERLPARPNSSGATDVFQETAASRFGLVCNRAALANLPTTCYFLGFFIGCYVYGALADRIGRLRVVQISLINMGLGIIAASQAPWLWLYCLLQLLTGHGDGGITASGMTYTVECTDAKHRGLWALSLYNGCTLGIAQFTLIAFCLRHYQQQLLCAGVSCLAFTLCLLLLTESPRWLASVGRFADADAALRRFDRFNNAGRPGGLRLPTNFSTEAMVAKQQRQTTGAGSFWQLLSRASLRRHTLTVWLLFFAVSVAYFGIVLGVGRLGGDIFINQLASAAVEPAARLLGAFASLRVGRRLSVCCYFGLAGACLLVTAVLSSFPHLAAAWRVGVAMVGKFWITMAFDLVYLYAAEVFPTALRSAGVGSGSSVSRAGALVSTLLPPLGTVWRPLPFLLFAAGPLGVAAAAHWLVVETRDRHLPEVELEMTAPVGDCEDTQVMVTDNGDHMRNGHGATNGDA